MKVLIAGDYCDAYRVSEKILSDEGHSMFEDVKPLVDGEDVSIVNFEFPVVLGSGSPIRKCGPALKGHRESVDAIKYAGFGVCTLANNHILDQGEKCCMDTMALLADAGIDTVGAGRNLAEAMQPLYINKGDDTLAIINCCENEFSIATDNTAGANPMNPIVLHKSIKEARMKADYVLVITHGGHEHFQLPDMRMKEIYHFFIDSGADAVVNHHQHCFSGSEIYNGKPIFYGLGNFLFDFPTYRNSPWNYGYMVELDFSSEEVSYRTIPYSQCDSTPCVTLSRGEELLAFKNEYDRLSKIIADDDMLKREVESYFDENTPRMLKLFEPYSNRITAKLFSMKLLPKLFRGKRVTKMLNYIACESHREMLVHALKK